MKDNVHTWVRLARFDLQHLSNSLGNAALEERRNWPSDGQGREVKRLTEEISRTLETTFDRRDLNFTFDVLENAISKLSTISGNRFYQAHLASKSYSDRKGFVRTYGEVVTDHITRSARHIDANRPPREVTAPGKGLSNQPFLDIGPIKGREDLPLNSIIPPVQSGPLRFSIEKGRLRTKRQSARPDPQDRAIVFQAKDALTSDANLLLLALRETNADPRLATTVSEIRDILASDADVIRLGIVSISSESLAARFAEQLPDIVGAKLDAFSAGLSLFVGQFPEWQRFVENAQMSKKLEAADVEIIYRTSKNIVQELKQNETIVDPQVPRSLELVLEAIQDPKRASKRAVFGVIRTLENLIGTIYIGFGGLIGSTFAGVKEGLKTSANIITVTVLLSSIATSAYNLSPSVSKVINSDWLEKASKIVEKSLAS